jgi:3-oxoadipate CoA-transferase beta subunit
VLDVTPDGLAVRDIVDGLSFAELEHLTGLALTDATQARADDLPLITGRV